MLRTGLGALAIHLLLAAVAAPCVWDSATEIDELRMDPGTYRLLAGFVPRHGPAYHEERLRRLGDPTPGEPEEDADDRAVSLMELGHFAAAHRLLQEQLGRAPGRYRSLSNLGALHARRGDAAAAVEWTRRALEVNPEGHPGVGDLYLRMLEWEAAAARAPWSIPEESFLGYPYEDGGGFLGLPGPEDVPYESVQVEALLRAEPDFADGYLVLGDLLREEGLEGLAYWAYSRALALGHPAAAVPEQRRAALLARWRFPLWRAVGRFHVDGETPTRVGLDDASRGVFERAREWREDFEAAEAAALVVDGPLPTFQEVAERVPWPREADVAEVPVVREATLATAEELLGLLLTLLAVALGLRLRRPAPAPARG